MDNNENISKELLKFVNDIHKASLIKTEECPSFITLKSIRDELSLSMSNKLVDKILTLIYINVNENFIKNKFVFNSVIKDICNIIVDIYRATMQEFSNIELFYSFCSEIKLEYSL